MPSFLRFIAWNYTALYLPPSVFFPSSFSLKLKRHKEKADEEETKLSERQKKEITKWFLLNSPPGEIQYVAKDVKAILNDEQLYREAASEVEMILQALEYENEQGKDLDEFFQSTAGKFQTDTGKAWASEIASRRQKND